MPPAGFETAVSVSERPQTDALHTDTSFQPNFRYSVCFWISDSGITCHNNVCFGRWAPTVRTNQQQTSEQNLKRVDDGRSSIRVTDTHHYGVIIQISAIWILTAVKSLNISVSSLEAHCFMV